MSQQTDSTLDAAAIVIRDESTINANTPLRVGTWMKNMNDSKVNNLDLALKAAPEITKAALIALIAASSVEKKPYKVTDSTYGIILLFGISPTDISSFAIKLGNVSPTTIIGYAGSYNIGSDIFTEQGRIATAPTVTNDGVHGFYVGQLLTTVDTGITYECKSASTGAAVWVPVGTVNFKKVLTQSDIYSGGVFPIAECPAVNGYHWHVITQGVKLSGASTPYDGGSVVELGQESASRPQYLDSAEILSGGSDIWTSLIAVNALGGSVSNECFRVNKGLAVTISTGSTSGDGTLTVYGSAILIQD